MTHRTAALVALAGGIVVAVGSFLPWAQISTGFGSVGLSGTQGGDGYITLVLGGAAALVALLNLEKPATSLSRGIIVTAGILATLVGIFDMQNLNERLGEVDTSVAIPSIGMGLFLVIGGGIATVVGGWQMTTTPECAGVTRRAPGRAADRHGGVG